jgi:multidrug efflux pump subunit AcrA (membrane-fusion protein)
MMSARLEDSAREEIEVPPRRLVGISMTPRFGLLALLLLAGCPGKPAPAAVTASPAASEAAPTGSWVTVTARRLREEVPAVGTLRARQTTRVGAQVSGEVKDVLVDVGARVTKGQPLVRLDPTFFEIELAQRRAEVESARAREASARQLIESAVADVERARAAMAETTLALERMRALWEKPEGEAPSIPRSRFDEAQFAHRQATAGVRAAESRVAEAQARLVEATVGIRSATEAVRWAEERLRETEVGAPFDGVVTERLVDPGEPVTATPVTHLLEVQETGALYLEFSLPQELLARVRAGSAAAFEAEGVEGATEVAVTLVFPTIDPATRSFRCRVALDDPRGRYSPGMLARVRVTTRDLPDALVVPRAALGAGDGGWSVRVRGPDGAATPRKVSLGLLTEDEAEVVEGLRAGEAVLVQGGGR